MKDLDILLVSLLGLTFAQVFTFSFNWKKTSSSSDLPFDHPVVATLREYEEKEKIKKLRKSYNLEDEEEIEEVEEGMVC